MFYEKETDLNGMAHKNSPLSFLQFIYSYIFALFVFTYIFSPLTLLRRDRPEFPRGGFFIQVLRRHIERFQGFVDL